MTPAPAAVADTLAHVTLAAGFPRHDVQVERELPYGHGKMLDIYRPMEARASTRPQPLVLLWHGVGPDERDVLEPLAHATAVLGITVIVPDWRSDSADGGRAHLLSSLSFTRQHAPALNGSPDAIVLAGWSRGGRAAAGIAVSPPAASGWHPAAVVCLASGFSTPAPITGIPPASAFTQEGVTPVPIWLVHGIYDAVVSITESREFAALLTRSGWPVHLEELLTDHAGVVMTEYDPARGQCLPAKQRQAIDAGQRSAHILQAAAWAVTGQSRNDL